MKKKVWLHLALLMGIALHGRAQDSYPKEGELFPNHAFTDVKNMGSKTLRISDYRGKWLVLDIWSMGCTGCIRSFPKIDTLSKKFAGRATILLTGIYQHEPSRDKEKTIKEMMDRQIKLHKLTLPYAFDSLARNKYKIRAVPDIFVINPQGILVAKSHEIDEKLLEALMKGEKPHYFYARSNGEPTQWETNPYAKLPWLTNAKDANGGTDTAFLFRSLFSKWTPEQDREVGGHYHHGFEKPWDNRYSRHAAAYAYDLRGLTMIAHFGNDRWGDDNKELFNKMYPQVIVDDEEAAKKSIGNSKTFENMYVYSQTVPEKDTANLKMRRNILRKDLEQVFGIVSTKERRKLPVYALVVKDPAKAAKLKSKGGATLWEDIPGRPAHRMRNLPFETLVKHIANPSVLMDQDRSYDYVLPLIDKTDITFGVDIEHLDYTLSYASVKDFYEKYGLALVKDEMEMDCIVIRSAPKPGPKMKQLENGMFIMIDED